MSAKTKTAKFDTPSTEWIFQHDLNRLVTSDVFINANGAKYKIMPLSVEVVDLNQIKITFSQPQSGEVKVM